MEAKIGQKCHVLAWRKGIVYNAKSEAEVLLARGDRNGKNRMTEAAIDCLSRVSVGFSTICRPLRTDRNVKSRQFMNDSNSNGSVI